MKIPKNIQFIAAGVIAAGIIYLGYTEYSKMRKRIKTLESNLEIMHENMNRVARSGNTVVSTTSNQHTTQPVVNKTVSFSTPVTHTDVTTEDLEPEHIRVKKNEIERLEQQLENYESDDDDITDSDDFMTDDSEYSVSSNEAEEVSVSKLTSEDTKILDDSMNEIFMENDESVTEPIDDVVDFDDIVVDNGKVVDLSLDNETSKINLSNITTNVELITELLKYDSTQLQEKLKQNTCVELRNVLKQCNLSSVGRKDILISKLVNHITHQNKSENHVVTN